MGCEVTSRGKELWLFKGTGAIASLRDEACTQWASGWLAFQRKAASAYPCLDLNFDIPSDEEAEESLSQTALESQTPLLMPAPLLCLMLPLMTFELLYITLLVFYILFLSRASNPGYV